MSRYEIIPFIMICIFIYFLFNNCKWVSDWESESMEDWVSEWVAEWVDSNDISQGYDITLNTSKYTNNNQIRHLLYQ